ncbi:MAG: branched-chain amino acid ABC transporter permease [Chloroflexota bacterium]
MSVTTNAAGTPAQGAPDPASDASAGRLPLRIGLGWARPNIPAAAIALLVAAILPPLAFNNYWLHVLVIACAYGVVNMAWNLVLGVSGIWSFAQIAIFAIGGYTSGLLCTHLGMSPWLGMLFGGLVAMVVGILLGIPAFRVTGIYVALLTFAFNEVVRLLIVADDKNGITGGAFGLGGIPGFFDKSAGEVPYYLLGLALLTISSLVVWRIMYSPIGMAFASLRENPRYAVGRGIDPFKYQLLVFGISSFLTGIAGAFYASYLSIIQPQIMGLALSTNLLAMIVIGGMGTFSGPLVGTLVLSGLLEVLKSTEQLRLIVLGVILLVIIVAMPDGLVGGFARARSALSRWISEGDRPAEAAADGEAAVPDGGTAVGADDPTEAVAAPGSVAGTELETAQHPAGDPFAPTTGRDEER